MAEIEFPVGGAEGLPDVEGSEVPTNGKVYEFLRSIVNRLVDDWCPGNCQSLIEEKDYIELCYRAREAFWVDRVCLEIEPPITICGDIHGQFEDLCQLFSSFSFPPHFPVDKDSSKEPKELPTPQRYLFLGDYVDRGPFSIETISLLFALRLLYPDKIFLLRGNHESRAVNTQYGFYFECTRRFSINLYEAFQYAFNCMPICATVGNKIVCMHGGISEDLKDLTHLETLERPFDIPDVGVMSDLCWADPSVEISDYADSPRGAGRIFGRSALDEWLETHNLDMVVRAHQIVMDGYEFLFDKKLVTIFSAPCYCGHFDNLGAVMHVYKNMECTINCFADEMIYKNRLDAFNKKEAKSNMV